MELQSIQKKIYEIRVQKVMLDFDLAELFQRDTRALNQDVKRNFKRFPIDLIFYLDANKRAIVQSENVITSKGSKSMKSQIVTTFQKKWNVIATLHAFIEQGLAILSGILNSEKCKIKSKGVHFFCQWKNGTQRNDLDKWLKSETPL